MVSLLDSMRAHLRSTDDSHRVTALELLFDLVFVYSITNVTGRWSMRSVPRRSSRV